MEPTANQTKAAGARSWLEAMLPGRFRVEGSARIRAAVVAYCSCPGCEDRDESAVSRAVIRAIRKSGAPTSFERALEEVATEPKTFKALITHASLIRPFARRDPRIQPSDIIALLRAITHLRADPDSSVRSRVKTFLRELFEGQVRGSLLLY